MNPLEIASLADSLSALADSATLSALPLADSYHMRDAAEGLRVACAIDTLRYMDGAAEDEMLASIIRLGFNIA